MRLRLRGFNVIGSDFFLMFIGFIRNGFEAKAFNSAFIYGGDLNIK